MNKCETFVDIEYIGDIVKTAVSKILGEGAKNIGTLKNKIKAEVNRIIQERFPKDYSNGITAEEVNINRPGDDIKAKDVEVEIDTGNNVCVSINEDELYGEGEDKPIKLDEIEADKILIFKEKKKKQKGEKEKYKTKRVKTKDLKRRPRKGIKEIKINGEGDLIEAKKGKKWLNTKQS